MDDEIYILNKEDMALLEVTLPQVYKQVGEVTEADIQLYVSEAVLASIAEYAARNTDVETGSILIGEVISPEAPAIVCLTDFIEARHTKAGPASLTFTHDTWNAVYAEQNARFPNKKIIGWQHTHPGLSVFLSAFDLFIHTNFFPMAFQIAYVIDPIQNTQAFFQWKGNEIGKLPGYFVFSP